MIVKATTAVAIVLLGMTAGCAAGTAAQSCLQLKDGWVRAPLPGQDMTAGYGRLHNRCTVAVAIGALSSAQAHAVELHRTELVDGISTMRPAGNLQLSAGESVDLVPGGLHLMLHGLHEDVANGKPLELRINDSQGKAHVQQLPVRAR